MYTKRHKAHYSMHQIDAFIKAVKESIKDVPLKYKLHFNGSYMETVHYYNVPCAFDTETTSVYIKRIKTKTGYVYIWTFGINGISIYGRKIEDFIKLLDRVREELELSSGKRLICYIHNLQFDFQFFRKLLRIDDMFIMDSRKALYVLSRGIEFRCSYILSSESLAKVGDNLLKYKFKKKVGDLDYALIRNFSTKMTPKEMGYCFGDIETVMAYIQECIEQEGNDITKIPLTSTGYVRRECRDAVLKDEYWARYVRSLKLTVEEYDLWHRAFQGGFTHANARHTEETCKNVVSYDFTSSYPAVMCSEYFPMSNGIKVEFKDWETHEDENKLLFYEQMRTRILVFDICIEDIELKQKRADSPLSYSKCWKITKPKGGENVYHNGRVIKAKKICTTITSEDFIILSKFYKWSNYKIANCWSYGKGYLPKPLIEKILEYYEAKTSLKGVLGKEVEYLGGKKKVNAIFGMSVMDIVREVFGYDDDWLDPHMPSKEDKEDIINHYNNSKKRFNWYPWGVMITAYARKNLFSGIYEVGDSDYIYSDTDSMKILNEEKHIGYILEYNKLITDKLEMMCDHYQIDKERLRPKTIKGEAKPLGVWDFDGHYSEFKVLRAKTYIADMDDDPRNDPKDRGLHCTVAGVPKKAIKKYLEKEAKNKGINPFDIFNIGLSIPKGESDKRSRQYCDEELEFEVTDYQGNTDIVHSYSGVYLEEITFDIKDCDEMIDAIIDIIGSGNEEEGE